ncbi:hypothetical protein BJY01DRAFT_194684 [Aspergillus pseudoustus]|uniref:Uncharacterized protein n=1 Tax=Aspergillus pseudoustus TaxID=1810923 RepID=A0ABR4KX28_9EURO
MTQRAKPWDGSSLTGHRKRDKENRRAREAGKALIINIRIRRGQGRHFGRFSRPLAISSWCWGLSAPSDHPGACDGAASDKEPCELVKGGESKNRSAAPIPGKVALITLLLPFALFCRLTGVSCDTVISDRPGPPVSGTHRPPPHFELSATHR